MKNLGLEFKVGLFTLLGLISTGALFVALSDNITGDGETITYYTLLDNAGGIVPKSHVKTNGVSVGKVRGVELLTNNTKVTLDIRADVKIPDGSTLQIKSVGLLGDSHIEIYRTEDRGKYISSGELIPQSTDGTDLNSLIEIAGKIAKDIKQVTGNLADVLGSESGKHQIANIVKNIETFTDDARGILQDNRQDVRDMIANFRQVSESINGLLDEENREKLDRIIAAFDESMAEVKSATRNINLISERVERGEGTLGRLVNDDTAMTELEGAIKDIREVLAPATKLEIAVDTRMEARRDETGQAYFNLIFRTRPDRYYLLGLTDTEEEIVETKTENRDELCNKKSEECDSAQRVVKKTEGALKINLQFAKRWHFLVARLGLFESSGGLATDFYLFNDRLKWTIEAWDWKTSDNEYRRVAHFKSYLSVLFFDHIYILAGIDDPTKYESRGDSSKFQRPNWFVGAGLTFDDQDLRALFGAAAVGAAAF